jgi:hypothetical protein
MTRVEISAKQQPVIDCLSELFDNAEATAQAILDNAIDDGNSIPVELAVSFHKASNRIVEILFLASMKDPSRYQP